MAFIFTGTKEFVLNHIAAVALSAVTGAGLLVTLHYYPKYLKRGFRGSHGGYPELIQNTTLMAKYLTADLQVKLRDKATSNGYSLSDLIQHGIECPTMDRQSSGIVIGDEECYEVFRELIDPIVMDLHEVSNLESLNHTRKLKECDWRKVKGGKLCDKKIVSCRLSTSRNIKGYSLVNGLGNSEREEIAAEVVSVLRMLRGALRGDYVPISTLADCQQQRLGLYEDYGFQSSPGSLLSLLSRDWPHGRLVWWTEDRRSRVFVNFIDHIKFVVVHPGNDIQQALRQYCDLVGTVETILKEKRDRKYMWHKVYGYLTSSLSDMGTGLHIEVKLKLYRLWKEKLFERLIRTLPVEIQPSAEAGEVDIFFVTNKHCLGLPEVEIIQQVINSISLLLEIDKRLTRGESIRDILP